MEALEDEASSSFKNAETILGNVGASNEIISYEIVIIIFDIN